MSLFATNDELFARLRAGNPGFDVIVPSNEFVTRMSQAQMIVPLDRAKIPNFSNLLPEFQDAAFDPGRQYSMPYTWLTLGIGYRKDKVSGVPNSWRYLFDSDQYAAASHFCLNRRTSSVLPRNTKACRSTAFRTTSWPRSKPC